MRSPGLEGAGAAVVVAVATRQSRALIDQLGIPRVTEPAPDQFQLIEVEGVLELRPPGEADRPGIRPQFPPDRTSGSMRAHPLVRAFGRTPQRILDLTAGLGGDAYRLAAAGHDVLACERVPALAALLLSGWSAALQSGRIPRELAARLEFIHADADTVLAAHAGSDAAVYLDPMYPPPRRASALPRRELQVLRRLLGPDADASELVAVARRQSARVVVKRPTHAPLLAEGASFEVESKLVRFDVYLDPRSGGVTKA